MSLLQKDKILNRGGGENPPNGPFLEKWFVSVHVSVVIYLFFSLSGKHTVRTNQLKDCCFVLFCFLLAPLSHP